tara:strand:+ start:859 stop:1821 length:963 start_codon:yes stop_codon:yes gene_type:complete
MEKIDFRLATDEDKYGIADFLALSSPYPRPIKYWEWINSDKNFPGSFVVIATQMDKVVGHYAVSIREFSIFGVLKKVGVASQTLIHPSYRKLQILLDISNFLKDICQKKDLYMVIGFPNDNLYRINKKLLEWNQLTDVSQLELSKDKLTKQPLDFLKVRAFKFDNKFNQLIEFNNQKDTNIKESLTIDILNWRYFEHPLTNYAVFISQDYKKLINGFIVIKLYHSNEGLKGHIMEVSTFDDLNTIDFLLKSAFSYFNWANCDSVSLWSSKGDYKYSHLEKMGFKENSTISHLQVLSFSNIKNDVFNDDNWDLSMRMSDAY